MKTICIARLRENVKYQGPLEHILDSFYELYKRFMIEHPEYNYTFYNITFDGTKPSRNLEALKKADIVVIPTEHEFHYHIPGYFHTLSLARSNQAVEQTKEYIQNKKVILLRSDRADDEELYRKYTFKDIDFKMSIIDEIDFPSGIHGMKYWFMPLLKAFPEKEYDFCYWGSLKNKVAGGAKSQDDRHKILKDISKSNLKSFWIGRFTNIERNLKMRPLGEIVTELQKSRATLCFNWMSNKATTSRYHEALGNYMIPFVWKAYDEDCTLVKCDWQRVHSVDEFINKVEKLKDPGCFMESYLEVRSKYKIPDINEYYKLFEDRLLSEFQT